MNKYVISVSLILAVLLAGTLVYAIYKYSRIFWCATVRYSNFSEAETNVYVENVLKSGDSERLLDFLHQAKARIESLYGKTASDPVIIIVDSEHAPERYGLGPRRQTVRAYLTPWEKYLVISSATRDINLLAHEYFHIELCERIGYLAYKTKLPAWLDEGLAMQVDYREQYLIDTRQFDPAEIDRVKSLHSHSEFFSGSNERVSDNIRAAKAAVHRIIGPHSVTSLQGLFARVKNGEDIADVFSSRSSPHAVNAD